MSDPEATGEAKQRSLASRKFDFEDLINADPLCPLPALKIARAYLRFISDFEKDTAYVSLIDLQVATDMSTRAIIDNRNILVALGYFKGVGKAATGAVRYKLQFVRENIVLDHMSIKKETLRRLDAERKEKQRVKRQAAAEASVTEPDAVTKADDVTEPDAGPDEPGACTARRDVTEPDAVNYLEEYLDEDSTEDERLAQQTATPLDNNRYSAISGDDPNLPFQVPESAIDVEAMLAQICAGVLPSVWGYFRNRFLEGLLTPAEVEQQRRFAA